MNGRGPTTPGIGDLLTMVINHLTNWDDPPSTLQKINISHLGKRVPAGRGYVRSQEGTYP